MANKLKTIGFLFLSITTILFSCSPDESETTKNFDFDFQKRNVEDLFNDQNFIKAYEKLPKSKDLNSQISRTVMEDQYGFTFLGDVAHQIETDSIKSYTFQISLDSLPENPKTTNLVLQVNKFSNSLNALIFEYSNNQFVHYQGEISAKSILYNISLNNATSRLRYDCFDVAIPCPNHNPGDPVCWGPTVETVCMSYDDGGGGGGGLGDIVTYPVGGGGGGTSAPCKKLKNLSNSLSVKTSLINLETKTKESKESGYAYKQSSTDPNLMLPPAVIPNNPTDPTHLDVSQIVKSGQYAGVSHNHTDPSAKAIKPAIPMFSDQDLDILYSLANENTFTADFDTFFVTMSVRDLATNTNTTYAIKISDWNSFRNFWMYAKNKKALSEELKDKYKDVGTETPLKNLEKILLKTINTFGIGVSMFQASSDMTSWKEVTYDPDLNTVNKYPCL